MSNTYKISTSVGTNIRKAEQVSVRDKIILKKLLDQHDDLSLEYHLPKEVLAMDKAALLLLIYRLLPLVRE